MKLFNKTYVFFLILSTTIFSINAMDSAGDENSNPLIPEEHGFRKQTPYEKECAAADKSWERHSIKAKHWKSKKPRYNSKLYKFYRRRGIGYQAPGQDYDSDSE